jgi:hypothetical protein
MIRAALILALCPEGVDLTQSASILLRRAGTCRQPFVWIWRRVWYALIRFMGHYAPPRPARGESQMTRNELVLAALAAAGQNASFSPVQVQKLFFLIDREAAPLIGGPYFDFQPYDYGPFDSGVYSALSVLEAQALVQSTSSGRYRVYLLTPTGYQAGNGLLAAIPANARTYFQQVTAWIRSLSFAQLVSAIYSKYPDMKVNSVFRG